MIAMGISLGMGSGLGAYIATKDVSKGVVSEILKLTDKTIRMKGQSWYSIEGIPMLGPPSPNYIPSYPKYTQYSHYWDLKNAEWVPKECPTPSPDIYIRVNKKTGILRVLTCPEHSNVPPIVAPLVNNTEQDEPTFRSFFYTPLNAAQTTEDYKYYGPIGPRRTLKNLCAPISAPTSRPTWAPTHQDGSRFRPTEYFECDSKAWIKCSDNKTFSWHTLQCETHQLPAQECTPGCIIKVPEGGIIWSKQYSCSEQKKWIVSTCGPGLSMNNFSNGECIATNVECVLEFDRQGHVGTVKYPYPLSNLEYQKCLPDFTKSSPKVCKAVTHVPDTWSPPEYLKPIFNGAMCIDQLCSGTSGDHAAVTHISSQRRSKLKRPGDILHGYCDPVTKRVMWAKPPQVTQTSIHKRIPFTFETSDMSQLRAFGLELTSGISSIGIIATWTSQNSLSMHCTLKPMLLSTPSLSQNVFVYIYVINETTSLPSAYAAFDIQQFSSTEFSSDSATIPIIYKSDFHAKTPNVQIACQILIEGQIASFTPSVILARIYENPKGLV
jgi:hypothetical protein